MTSQILPEPLHPWLRVLAWRSPAKHLHSRRVADLAVGIGQHLGLPGAALARLWWGALLHDLGVVGIPDAIVNKPGSLTDAEWAVMRQHAPLGASLVSLSAFTPDVLAVACILRSHHERWDGSGYPDGLAGSHIPLVVRIIAVADVWDALLEDRPYRLRWEEAQVRDYLRDQAGKQFDSRVVCVLLNEVVPGAAIAESRYSIADSPEQKAFPPSTGEHAAVPASNQKGHNHAVSALATPLILGSEVALELATFLHRVRRSPGLQELVRLVVERVLARLAVRYAQMPALWAVAQGQQVEQGSFDIEWHSQTNQGCWIGSLEPGEARVLVCLLRQSKDLSPALRQVGEKLP